MLRPEADSDQASHEPLHARNTHKKLELPGRGQRPRVIEDTRQRQMRLALHLLNHTHRKLASSLYAGKHAVYWMIPEQGRYENARCGNRILYSDINAYSSGRRHRMRGIADAQ